MKYAYGYTFECPMLTETLVAFRYMGAAVRAVTKQQPTSIKKAEIEETTLKNEATFNLQGQRVLRLSHGTIYIKNGKKIIYNRESSNSN